MYVFSVYIQKNKYSYHCGFRVLFWFTMKGSALTPEGLRIVDNLSVSQKWTAA